ncbi:MAG: DASS family sodium-coupled anion symporter [Planctomycetaceae bacterium]|nr:DASS family sodium-coupled anion symporter [Planctomycetaceae bacterium]
MKNASLPAFGPKHFGRILGPLMAFCVYILTTNAIPESARLAAASGTLMVTFWVTEAIPLPATALLPLALFPTLGVIDVQQAAAPFAKPVIFLFLGGFMIALAVENCGLHRRVAMTVVRLFGGKPGQLLAGCMVATAFLSMWISNTAATVMMLPIATSLTSLLWSEESTLDPSGNHRNVERCFLLGIAYSANIGGLGTIVGTPPNALLAGFLQEHGISLGFGRWMLFAIPLVILFLGLCWLILNRFALKTVSQGREINAATLNSQYHELGPMTRAQWNVLSVFSVAVALWVFREPISHCQWMVECCPWVTRLNDASIAITAAVTLFLLPSNKNTGEKVLDWESASELPWGVLVLIGGGMSLASAMGETGLTAIMGSKLDAILTIPPILLIVVLTALVIFLTEIISNTAITAAMLPILFGLGANNPTSPLSLVIPATLAASCAFMLPIGTPPNAVVFGTGRLPMRTMMGYGMALNLLGTLLIPGLMCLFGWILF